MQTFHEDVIQTFLFCFLVAMGIIQIMVAWRGWHGLSIYGGRVRKNVNYALGTGLVIFGYAWYFSDPMHRNTRNIEGVMSIVCLVLGVAAAAVLTGLLASLAEAIRRRRGRGGGSLYAAKDVKRIALSQGKAILSAWGDPGGNLVVLAEPGKGNEGLLASALSALPPGCGFVAVKPSGEEETILPALLRELQEREGLELSGEVFMGLGWASNELARLQQDLEDIYRPKAFLAVAPIIPSYSQNIVGDALTSNTPLDISEAIVAEKPWRTANFKRMLRIWLPVFIACCLLATAATLAFDVRWKFVFGPAAGLVLSLWFIYYVASWRGLRLEGGRAEMERASTIAVLLAPNGACPTRTVLTSDGCLEFRKLPEDVRSRYPAGQIEFWGSVLRGKFLLEEGTMRRLLNLIWEEKEQGNRLDDPTGTGN